MPLMIKIVPSKYIGPHFRLQIVDSSRTYAVGVLARARGPLAPENLLFPPTCGGFAATGGWKKKGVLWRALPSKPPNRVTPILCFRAPRGNKENKQQKSIAQPKAKAPTAHTVNSNPSRAEPQPYSC